MSLFNRKKKPDIEISWADIDSKDKAIEAVNRKELYPMLMLPPEWGGVEDDRNIVYVPSFVLDSIASIDRIVNDLIKQGREVDYKCTPSYKGNSVVPSKLVIKIKTSTGGNLDTEIDIW